MTIQAQTKINPKLSESEAANAFNTWIKEGVATHKAAAQQSKVTRTEVVYVKIAIASGVADGQYEATVGTFDQKTYTRELALHQREVEAWKRRRSGSSEREPLPPSKKDFYDKSFVDGSVKDNFQAMCFVGASEEIDSPILKKMRTVAEAKISKFVAKGTLPEGETHDSLDYDVDALKETVNEQCVKLLTKQAKSKTTRYDKVYDLKIVAGNYKHDTAVFEVPFYLMNFECQGETFTFAVDAMDGASTAGTKPKSAGAKGAIKFVQSAGIASLLVAGYLGFEALKPLLFS